MLNRGKLRRDIENGLVEGRLGFHIGYDDSISDRFGKKSDRFVPARVIRNASEFKEGHMNIFADAFKSKSGSAYMRNGLINFGSHSNENILLRYKRKLKRW